MRERSAARSVVLFPLFLVTCFALGYATLNRYDPSQSIGVGDSLWYFRMVETGVRSPDVTPPYRYRVLVPQLARFAYQATNPVPLGSWNRPAFALLLVNSILVSLTALAISRLARLGLGDTSPASLVAPFLYLAAFPIANGHLAGLVDSGEGLCLALLALTIAMKRWRLLPLVFLLGALAKESAVVLSTGFLAGAWLSSRRPVKDRQGIPLGWAVTGVAAGIAGLAIVRFAVGGPSYEYHVISPHNIARIPVEFLRCLASRSVVYTFIMTIPLAIIAARQGQLPRFLVAGSIGAAAAAYLAGSYAAITENIARPLYNAIGPLVSIGAAAWLTGSPAESPRPPGRDSEET